MTLNDDMRALVALLMQATRRKKIRWEADPDSTELSAVLENGSVELLQDANGGAVNLLVRDEQKLLLDETGFLSQQASPELAELAREAHGSIRKSNGGLANIISGLRQKLDGL
jgi:hypothetical protein